MLINGKKMKFQPNVTILEVLKELKLNPDVVVVEVNHEIISKEKHPSWILNEGDRVEIVSFIGGG
ncbi:sulfur carrier protein ThiS [Alkaliphilus hydrothermalis]|uniref:Sulfur carrier protein n=1 Tax=Alkaliphilus hydrothermalis TaxID=1482730 RepID=A0ABS2NSF5_9FIRM|nr:sulfur carrier protein ThiS [Alkaliphilus hydrothermalis]MBM7615871.1 sulfur carrier protein [Alkaliphilus hydrothermalis]